MARKKVSRKADQPGFEESLVQLQEIVSNIESGSLGLDESLAEFERGITLMKSCQEFLNRAERKVELLTGIDSEGNPTSEPFDETATADARSRKSDEMGGSLF